MSEIEKMYELAGVEKEYKIHTIDWQSFKEYYYPPFTAEKQIAILQLLTQQCDLTISHFTEWEFIHYDGQEPTQVTGEDFAETFAKLINAYWQSLTEEEKQQVKGILE